MNGYQARKINEMRNMIFGRQLWETFLSVKAEVEMFTIWVLRKFWKKKCWNNDDSFVTKK